MRKMLLIIPAIVLLSGGATSHFRAKKRPSLFARWVNRKTA